MTARFTAAAIALVALAILSGCATHELHREGVVDVDAGRFEVGLQKL